MAAPALPCGAPPDAPLCPCGKHRPRPPATLCKQCRLQAANAPLCRHCHSHPSTRPRRLCSTCFNDTSVRRMYRPQRNRVPDHGIPDVEPRRPPKRPTLARPGSEEKVAILEARAALGWGLWHPLDDEQAPSKRTVKRAQRLLGPALKGVP